MMRRPPPSPSPSLALSALGLGLALFWAGACGDPTPPQDSGAQGPATSAAAPPLSPSSLSSSSASPSGGPLLAPAVPPPPRPANADELAILAPAAPGGALADFTIKEIHGVNLGTIDIFAEKGAARVVLSVALLSPDGPSAPASTDKYAVFYSLRGATPDDGERLANAILSLLKANASKPAPPGLGPFVPRPVSL